MKKILLATTVALMALAGTNANAMTPKTVKYSCDGKPVLVTYSFNANGIPTKAVSKLNTKRPMTLAYNKTHSDVAGTMFGKTNGYSISTEYMDANNYNQVSLGPITNAKNQIIYKSCEPN